MYRTVKYWFIGSFTILLAAFTYFYLTSNIALTSHYSLFIWIIAGIVALYTAKNKINQGLSGNESLPIYILAVSSAVFSFFCIRVGFCNPPYNIGEFTMLLSSLSIIYFTYLGFRPLIMPSAFPLISVLGYQVFDLFQENIDSLSQPFVQPTTELTAFMLRLFSLSVDVEGNIISFLSVDGSLMPIKIVPDCTGIWSIGAFTASLILVALVFPRVFSRESVPYIMVGYVGTYAANITRVVLICLSAYFYGYSGATQIVHVHAGWVAFSTWMIIFWYLFFSRYLLRDSRKTAP
jgi:exosortase/archaeosortase family protein